MDVAVPYRPSPGARLVADDLLIDVGGQPRLLASRCTDCRAVTFPAQRSCPRCTGQDVQRHALADHGTLWTYTVQNFRPKTPYLGADGAFQPYGVGYVDLGGEVLVEGRLVVDDLAVLRIGLPVQLVLEPFHRGPDGEDVLTFAFAPTREGGAA
jgi:uncharacterized OB-fold protein